MARGANLAHQLEAGIGDQGGSGVRDQGDGCALRQPFEDFWPRQRGVVFVIGFELGRDRIAFGEPAGDAGIFAGDDIDAGQGFQGAQGDVAEITDRGCHQMKPGGSFRRGQNVAADRECAGSGARRAFNYVCIGSF